MRIWFVQEHNTVAPAELTRRLLILDSGMQPIILPQLLTALYYLCNAFEWYTVE